jgi:hypothetical protein
MKQQSIILGRGNLEFPGERKAAWSNLPYARNGIRREHYEPIKALAKVCIERADNDPDFAERHARVLEFWIGAAQMARIAGLESLSEDIAKLGVLEITPRGYQAVLELALF